MNVRQLEVLRTLLVTGSTIATARAMGLSQSGVSRLLQQLEANLSMQLFARDKGRLIPTPEAEKLAYDAELVLAGIDRFTNLAQDLRSGAVGPESVRIALPNSLADQFTPDLLAPRCEGCIGVGTAEQVSAVPISVWGTVESCSVVLVMKFRRFPVSRGKASYHRKNSMRHRTYLLQ